MQGLWSTAKATLSHLYGKLCIWGVAIATTHTLLFEAVTKLSPLTFMFLEVLFQLKKKINKRKDFLQWWTKWLWWAFLCLGLDCSCCATTLWFWGRRLGTGLLKHTLGQLVYKLGPSCVDASWQESWVCSCTQGRNNCYKCHSMMIQYSKITKAYLTKILSVNNNTWTVPQRNKY